MLGRGNGLGEKAKESSHLQGRERGTQAGAGVARTSRAGVCEYRFTCGESLSLLLNQSTRDKANLN